jgi:hypothetical protein
VLTEEWLLWITSFAAKWNPECLSVSREMQDGHPEERKE